MEDLNQIQKSKGILQKENISALLHYLLIFIVIFIIYLGKLD